MAGQTIGGLFSDQARGEAALEELKRANFSSAQISEVAEDRDDVTPKKLSNPVTDFFRDHTTTASDFRDNLADLGMSKKDAHYFEDGVARGGALVTVRADERAAEAVDILTRNGADLGSQARNPMPTQDVAPASASNTAGASRDAERTLRLKAERLAIEKTHVASGDVRVRKNVVSHEETVDVPVSHDELFIERHPVTDGAVGGTIGTDQKITIPLSREELSVGKRTVVTEEVAIGKRAVTETKHVSENVRHEELVVDGDERVEPPAR